jgi:hypothetical protein
MVNKIKKMVRALLYTTAVFGGCSFFYSFCESFGFFYTILLTVLMVTFSLYRFYK